jgi:uncharacterized protein YbjT (DUF2867 family)
VNLLFPQPLLIRAAYVLIPFYTEIQIKVIKEADMKFLIAGATGTIGRQLVEQLNSAGHHVRALTRNPAKANFSDGVEVVVGDLTKPETFAAALEGVTGLHLVNFGGDDYAPLESGAEIVVMAEKAGVKRVTVLRGGQESALELAVQSSSLAWTMLQPVEFMSNMLEWKEMIQTEGVVSVPFATRKTAIVHEADIAAVAAAALTEEGHGGKTYTITGPEVLTPPEMVSIIGAAIGRDIQFIELTEAQAREQWAAEGYPEEVIEFFVWAHGNTPPIGYTVVPTVEQVTGRPALTFAQWAAEHINDFRVRIEEN